MYVLAPPLWRFGWLAGSETGREKRDCSMRESFYVYRSTARSIAACMMRGGPKCDVLAHDVDDYESILLAKAWYARQRWLQDPTRVSQGRRAEEKYVCAALWTEARRYERARMRGKRAGLQCSLEESDLVDDGFERRQEARDIARAARAAVTPLEWEAVVNKTLTHSAGGRVYRRSFRRAVTKIRRAGIGL